MRLKKFSIIAILTLICCIAFTFFSGCNDKNIDIDGGNDSNLDNEFENDNNNNNDNNKTVVELTLDNYSDYIVLQAEITSFYYTLSNYSTKSYRGDFTRISKVSVLKLKDVTFEDVIMTVKFDEDACRDENNRLYGWKNGSSTFYLAYNGEGYTTITSTGTTFISKDFEEGDIERMHYAPNEFEITQITGNVILK